LRSVDSLQGISLSLPITRFFATASIEDINMWVKVVRRNRRTQNYLYRLLIIIHLICHSDLSQGIQKMYVRQFRHCGEIMFIKIMTLLTQRSVSIEKLLHYDKLRFFHLIRLFVYKNDCIDSACKVR